MIDNTVVNKAILLSKNGKIKEAEALYLDLLKDNSNEPALLSVIGLFYATIGNSDEACKYLEKACELNETAGNLTALGYCEYERHNYIKASHLLEKSLNYNENEDVYDKLITSYFCLKNYLKASEYSYKMYEKYPKSEKSTANLVKSLTYCGKLQEAESICVDYLKANLDSALLWTHLGFLKELIYSNDVQACECFKKAESLGSFSAKFNIAVSYQKQGMYKEAENYYKEILSKFPDDKEAHSSYGMCLLKQKDFKNGYKHFFLRDKSKFENLTNNPWTPQAKLEENITIIGDQGFGDNIQFIRYLPFLKEKCKNVYVATRKPLRKLFEQTYKDVKFIDYSDIDPSMQSIYITDLAYALDIDFSNIPFSEGYLYSEKTEIESDKTKIGLCWEAGSAAIRTMINRTINPKLLKPIFDTENAQFYSFQKDDSMNGNEMYPEMIKLDFNDFEDTAKAINSMDLIITVDTAIAHLAGALGKQTFLLLPYVSDWRWFDDKETTPWYKSVELFKQTDNVSWEEQIQKIAERIRLIK